MNHFVPHSPQYIHVQVKVYAYYTDAAIGTPDLKIRFVAANNSSTTPVSVNTNTGFTGVPFDLPEVGFDNTRQGEDAQSTQHSSDRKATITFVTLCQHPSHGNDPKGAHCYQCPHAAGRGAAA